MRILVVSKSYPEPTRHAYGADLMCRGFARHLAAAGHELVVLTTRQVEGGSRDGVAVWPRLVNDRPDPRLQPEHWRKRHKLEYLRKARHNYAATGRALRAFRPDVVYLSDLELLTGSLLRALQAAGRPLVFHAHDYTLLEMIGSASEDGAPRPGGLRQAVLDWCLCPPQDGPGVRSCRLLAVSRDVAERYRAAGWREGRVQVVYNGLGEEFFRERPREFPSVPSVLLAGRCVPDKGLHVAVEALGQLARRGWRPELHLVGTFQDEAYRQRIEELATRVQVSEQVKYRGYVPAADMPAEYARHACSLVTSLWPEPFGLVSVEAQAQGTPVIVSRTGGLPETVQDGETGLVTPPGDATALAQALETLLTDPGRWQRMSDAGRLWSRERFSLSRAAGQVEAALTEAARNGAH